MIILRLATAVLVCTAASLVTSAAANGTAARSSPAGHLDSVAVTAGASVTVSGWAADPDTAAPVRVALLLNGGTDGTMLATGRRNDVARVFPRYGAQRGFTGAIAVPPGEHVVCVEVVNVGAGSNVRLGCRRVTMPGSPPARAVPPRATAKPIGYLDRVTYSHGSFTYVGWSIDPDAKSPTLVDLTAGRVTLASVAANANRPDVGRSHPTYGPMHGLRATVTAPTTPGNYLACATALNTGAGPARQLGCRLVTVPPRGVPPALGTATAAAAATALQARAIAAHAARASDFPAGASSAARLAIAVRALLQQAAGLRPAPPPVPGVPTYRPVTPAHPVDEQAVIGPTPDLGSYPPARTGGRTGRAHAIEHYANDPLPTPSVPGDGLVGAAPILPANGTTVRPTLPRYPAHYQKLRAEAAVDAALSQLGVPYVYAAAGPNSFDCSGLTTWAWAKAGVSIYHYTVTQSRQGVRIRPHQLLPGDLVLFGAGLHHVGMYLGAGYMIDAPYTGSYVRVDKIAAYGDFTLAVRP